MKRKAYYLILSLIVVSIALLFVGSVWLSPGETVKSPILWQIRLPRVLLSALVGVMLATSGVMLQGILKNPLADPYILGVSSGAGVGAAIAIAANYSFVFLGMSSVPLFAFVFALIMVLTVYNLSKAADRTTPETLILAGVAVSAFASAVLALIIIMSGQLQSIYFWLLGSFSAAGYRDVFTVLPYAVVGLLIAYFYSKELNALLLGEEIAYTLGVEVERIRVIMIVAATLMTAAAVSVSGLIGFVGLIVPHFVRMIIGPNYRSLVVFSALSGALLMMIADAVARTALSPVELPVGIVMSLIGAPFFIWVLRTRRGG